MNDDIMTRLANARPPLDPTWVDTPDGQHLLARVIRNSSPAAVGL